MFRVPKACPEEIRAELRAAFSLYWSNLGSCLNRQRVAVELLLTHMRVPKRAKKKDGGMFDLTLHARIELLGSKKKHASLCESLFAVKWLGNEGSHPGDVKRKTVFDAFDMLEHVLVERFENPRRAIVKLTNSINKNKGSRRTGTKR